MTEIIHKNRCDICGKTISVNQFRCIKCCEKYRDVYIAN